MAGLYLVIPIFLVLLNLGIITSTELFIRDFKLMLGKTMPLNMNFSSSYPVNKMDDCKVMCFVDPNCKLSSCTADGCLPNTCDYFICNLHYEYVAYQDLWDDTNSVTFYKPDGLDHCASNPCQNGGSCVHDSYTFKCLCNSYIGLFCNIMMDLCCEHQCQNGATCVQSGAEGYTCNCREGYTGHYCDIIDYCGTNPCNNGGTCVVDSNGYDCQCRNGFTGIKCDINIDDCSSNPCRLGTCEDLVDDYVCNCSTSFYGLTSDPHNCECQPEHVFGVHCFLLSNFKATNNESRDICEEIVDGHRGSLFGYTNPEEIFFKLLKNAPDIATDMSATMFYMGIFKSTSGEWMWEAENEVLDLPGYWIDNAAFTTNDAGTWVKTNGLLLSVDSSVAYLQELYFICRVPYI